MDIIVLSTKEKIVQRRCFPSSDSSVIPIDVLNIGSTPGQNNSGINPQLTAFNYIIGSKHSVSQSSARKVGIL